MSAVQHVRCTVRTAIVASFGRCPQVPRGPLIGESRTPKATDWHEIGNVFGQPARYFFTGNSVMPVRQGQILERHFDREPVQNPLGLACFLIQIYLEFEYR